MLALDGEGGAGICARGASRARSRAFLGIFAAALFAAGPPSRIETEGDGC